MNTHLYAGIRFLRFGFALGVFAAGTSHAAGQAQDYPIAEVPVRDVKITGGFWRQRLDTLFSTTLGHVLKECKETRRLDNFAIAAGVRKGEFKGASFNDSDVYKTVEGMSLSETGPMKPEQRKFLEDFVGLLAKARWDDGCLFTFYQVKNELGKRFTVPLPGNLPPLAKAISGRYPTKSSRRGPRRHRTASSAGSAARELPSGSNMISTDPKPVSSSSVYWYDRFGTAQRLPKAWRLLYRDGADWKPVVTKDSYGLATDTSNTVHFAPVKTDALRLEADLQQAFLDPYLAAPDAKPSKFSAGILE